LEFSGVGLLYILCLGVLCLREEGGITLVSSGGLPVGSWVGCIALAGRSTCIDFALGGKVDIHTHQIWFFVAGVKSRNSSNRKGHALHISQVCVYNRAK
jgi:hypothetical protein